jgi:hypothetical protein
MQLTKISSSDMFDILMKTTLFAPWMGHIALAVFSGLLMWALL